MFSTDFNPTRYVFKQTAWLASGVGLLTSVVVWLFFQAAIEQQTQRLEEIARSRIELIRVIAEHERLYHHASSIGDHILAQLRSTHESFPGIGKTGEVTLAQAAEGKIVFLLRHRHGNLDMPSPIPMRDSLAEPMRRALSGRTGTLQGLDYRGVKVLAAHRTIPELGWGIVAKIDLAEVRTPYIRAGVIAIVLSILGVAANALLVLSSIRPFLKVEEKLRLQAHWADPHISLVTDKNGEPAGLIGIDHDITARKQTERELRRYQDMVANTSDCDTAALVTVRDITELKQAEQQAESASRFLRAILDETPDIIVLKDRDFVYRVANRMFCEFLGKPEEEILGKTDFDLFPCATAEMYRREDTRVMESGQAQSQEEKVSAGMEKKCLYVSKVPFKGDTKEIRGVLIVVRDITAQKQTEHYRRLNGRRMKRLLELNREAAGLDDREMYARALDIGVEVTKSRVGYLHIVNEDQQTINLVVWNQTALERCSAAYGNHYPLSEAGIWADCARRRVPVIHNDYPHERGRKGLPEGHFPVRRHMSVPVVEDGRVGLIIGVGNKEAPYTDSDVQQLELVAEEVQKFVERRRAEEALIEARQQAETANRAKSVFLANMSHELRTPLNGILGYTQILANFPGVDGEIQDRIQIIQRSGEYLLTLINDILDLSKIEAGKLELQPHEMYLFGFLDEIAHLFSMRADQKNIYFHYERCQASSEESKPGLPAVIEADEKRLRQVLMNLLGNAMKFTEHGQVALRVTCLGSTLRVEVSDSGRGIAAGDMEAIFEPFRQVGAQQHQEGTGLGLPICRKLVRMMGGELTVESTLDQGSRFWFEIPLQVVQWSDAPEFQPLQKSWKVGGYRGASKAVLVVDDVAVNRKILTDFLTPLGFSVSEAEDGTQALTRAADFHPDVIFMDLRLPVMDGLEATRRLRKLPEFAATPIFAVSAGVFEEQQQQASTAGCTAFLHKPVDFPILLKLLEDYCGIQWIKIEEEEEPAGEELIPPPAEILEELLELVMYGDIKQLRISLTDLIENGPLECVPYCRQALQLTNAFELKKLHALLDS